jgi:hypothetical protein
MEVKSRLWCYSEILDLAARDKHSSLFCCNDEKQSFMRLTPGGVVAAADAARIDAFRRTDFQIAADALKVKKTHFLRFCVFLQKKVKLAG